MRFGSPPRVEPFAIALGLSLGTLAFRAIPTAAAPVSSVQVAGAVAVVVWLLTSQRPAFLEWILDHRLYWIPCIGTIGVWLVIVGTTPAQFMSHVPFWTPSIVTGFAVLTTGQRRHAKLRRDRNRVHERIDGRSGRWTNLLWTMVGGAIGILGVKIVTNGPRPVGELLRQLAPVLAGSPIGTLAGFLIVDQPNTVELLVLDDALVLVPRSGWVERPIDWRRVRTVDGDDDTLHVRPVLWSSSIHCDLSDVDRPQETIRAFRKRANCD